MKKISSIVALMAALTWISCTPESLSTINEITDHYNVPEDAVTLTLSDAHSTWSTDRRYFDLSFGNELTTTLVGYDALLATGQYVLGADEIGKAVLAKTKIGGQAVMEGFVTVYKKGGGYAISALIDGKTYVWEGNLPFTADPDPLSLTVLQKTQKNDGLVSMELATEGISQEFDMSTYQMKWTGEGKYIAIDLYSEDGYLHEGTYMASAEGGVVNPGEFGIGYDTTVDYGWGPMEMKDWGTCLWTVADGAATAEKIAGGIITVARNEKVWTVSWGQNYPVEVLFEGEIPALTKPEAPTTIDFKYALGEPVSCSTQDGSVVAGVKKTPVTITDAAGEIVAYLEFVLADGETELEGTYVSTEYAHEAGQLANGYYLDYSEWGIGIIKGGSYYMLDGKEQYIDPGKEVEVKKIAKGAYEFIGEGFDVAAAGPDYEGGDDGILLTQFLSLTSYVGQGQNLVGLELATDGITYSPADYSIGKWNSSYDGDGYYVKLEVYSTDGTVAPGTYTACAVGGVVGEGEFGIGYQGEWGAYGSNWYTVTASTPAGVFITDGTAVISVDKEVYTIVVESTAANFKYVGKLSAE